MSRRWELTVRCPKCGKPLVAEEMGLEFDGAGKRVSESSRYRVFCADCDEVQGVCEIAPGFFAAFDDEDKAIVEAGNRFGEMLVADYWEDQPPVLDTCWGVTPDPDLYPRLPLTGNGDNGRLLVYLLPGQVDRAHGHKGEAEVRVFCWVHKDWPDSKPIPEQIAGNEQCPGEFLICLRVCEDAEREGQIADFDGVRHALAGLPWSQRWEWLADNGFVVLE